MDHLIPHIMDQKLAQEMCDALITLYRCVNISHKIMIKSKLTADIVTSYLVNIIKLWDQPATTEMTMENEEMVLVELNGFSSSREPFVQGVCAHEKLPTFEKLKADFIQK